MRRMRGSASWPLVCPLVSYEKCVVFGVAPDLECRSICELMKNGWKPLLWTTAEASNRCEMVSTSGNHLPRHVTFGRVCGAESGIEFTEMTVRIVPALPGAMTACVRDALRACDPVPTRRFRLQVSFAESSNGLRASRSSTLQRGAWWRCKHRVEVQVLPVAA